MGWGGGCYMRRRECRVGRANRILTDTDTDTQRNTHTLAHHNTHTMKLTSPFLDIGSSVQNKLHQQNLQPPAKEQ